MKPFVLHTTALRIGYKDKKGSKTVAENLDLKFRSGKLIALLGANGAGKSTLLRTLTGMQQPLGGSVFLGNVPLEQLSANARAQQLSVVLTDKLPPSNLTLFELVALGRQPYTNWLGNMSEDDRKKVWQALENVGLKDLAAQQHDAVSDGQLQKALIARALAQDTPLVLLDEPTTHLDLQHKFGLMKLLRQLSQNTQKCILFSTHDIDLALDFCDELVVMIDGETHQGSVETLVAYGIMDRLFQDPQIQFDPEKRRFLYQKL